MSANRSSHFLFGVVFILLSGITVSAQRVDYSDSWMVDTETSTTLHGSGITDESYTNYGHEYTVATSLTTPSGLTVTGYGSSGSCLNGNLQCSRADVSLSLLDANGDFEQGEFTVETLHQGFCPYWSMELSEVKTIIVTHLAIAVTNYILTDFEGGLCVYYLWCPNGNASATCPANNPVYVNPAQSPCKNYLFDGRLRAVIAGSSFCFPIGKAVLSNTPAPCT